MHELEARFGHWVIRLRWPIILATLVLLGLAASGAQHLKFTNNYRIFFAGDNPQLQAFESMENTYNKQDNVLFVLAPADGDVFTRETLAAVEQLTEQSWQIPYSTRVDSITNYQHTEAEEDDLVVRDLVEEADTLSDEELARVRDIALHEPLLVNRVVSPAAHVTAVNVTIQLPGINETTEVPEVTAFARNMVAELTAQHPDIQVYLSGMVIMNNAFAENGQGDMKRLIPIAFLVMLVFLAFMLRGISGTLVTALVIIFSVMTAMGLGGHLRIPLSPPTTAAPIMILTLAIASSVHILVTFFYEMRHHGRDRKTAMIESLRVNLQPVFLTSVTTALGFLSMNFSEAPPFRHLGNLVAMGVAASFLFSVSFLPAVMTLLPVRVRQVSDGHSTLMDQFGGFVVRRRKGLLIGMSLLTVTLVAMVPKNELNDVFVEYFDQTVPFRQASDFIDANLGGLYRIDYSLESGNSGGVSDPAFLERVEAFSNWWRQQPETVHVTSFTDTMKRLNKNMHGDDPAWYRLPDERELAAQYLLLYEMSLPYGLDLNNQINVDKSATRLAINIHTLSSREVLALEDRATAWLHSNAPELGKTEGSGPTVMFAHIGSRNIKSMLMGATLALVLISIILIVALRSVKIGLVSMIPNLVPAAMGFGLWALIVGEVGLGLSVVVSMTLGIVVDDTVHFLSKYLRAEKEHHSSPTAAVRYAFSRVGMALFITSVVLVAGFLVISQSHFYLNSGMGVMTAIVITFALLADFLLLPPLLMKLEERENAKAANSTAPA